MHLRPAAACEIVISLMAATASAIPLVLRMGLALCLTTRGFRTVAVIVAAWADLVAITVIVTPVLPSIVIFRPAKSSKASIDTARATIGATMLMLVRRVDLSKGL